jgi:hypothetical protein
MAERVVLCSTAGVADTPATTLPPPLGMAVGRKYRVDEDDEDDKDEYHAPYLACQMSCAKTRTPGLRTPRLLASGHA